MDVIVSPKKHKPASKLTSTLKEYIKYKYFVLMFLPVIAYYIIFRYIPITGIVLAFKDFKIKAGIWGSPWVGFKHFQMLFQSLTFSEVVRNTIIISLYKLVIGFPVPIAFALLLNEVTNVRFKKVVQTVSYLPHFLSWVVLGALFTQFLSPSTGPVNIVLKSLGFDPIYFLGSTRWFRSTLVMTSIWQSFGWGSIVYIAALSGIDPQMYESAEIDGATRWQKMWAITIPSLAPVITIMFILAVGKLINDDFDQIFNLYNPAVYKVGDVISTYAYRRGVIDMSYEMSTAIGLFQNMISFILIIMTNTITKKFNDYGIW